MSIDRDKGLPRYRSSKLKNHNGGLLVFSKNKSEFLFRYFFVIFVLRYYYLFFNLFKFSSKN